MNKRETIDSFVSYDIETPEPVDDEKKVGEPAAQNPFAGVLETVKEVPSEIHTYTQDETTVLKSRMILKENSEELSAGALYHGEAIFNEGKWVQHGQGTEVRESKNTYVGSWVKGVRSGKGTCFYSDGNKYVGQFENDKQNGLGIKTWADGKIYDGGWKDKKQHGYGYFTDTDGTKRNGNWVKGERVEWIGEVNAPRENDLIDSQFIESPKVKIPSKMSSTLLIQAPLSTSVKVPTTKPLNEIKEEAQVKKELTVDEKRALRLA